MTDLPLFGGMLRTYFAAAAARERDAREKAYPQWVLDGKIARDVAESDLGAWRAIAELLATGSCATPLSWAELEHATANALLRREEALAAKPGDQALTARRDAVYGIHERISWHRASIMRAGLPQAPLAKLERAA